MKFISINKDYLNIIGDVNFLLLNKKYILARRKMNMLLINANTRINELKNIYKDIAKVESKNNEDVIYFRNVLFILGHFKLNKYNLGTLQKCIFELMNKTNNNGDNYKNQLSMMFLETSINIYMIYLIILKLAFRIKNKSIILNMKKNIS
jgi:hypothetical protein